MGCATVDASTQLVDAPAAQVAHDAEMGQEAFYQMVQSGAAGNIRGLRVVQWYVKGSDAQARAEARSAADVLMGACPYNRSAVQLVLVAQMVVAKHNASGESPEVQAEWARIRDGLALQVSLLDDLAVTALRAPVKWEYLFDHADVIVTRAQLEASDDPVGLTKPLQDQTQALVEGYDLATTQFIEMSVVTLDGYTAGHWPFSGFTGGWSMALAGIERDIQDPAMKDDVRALREALKLFADSRC